MASLPVRSRRYRLRVPQPQRSSHGSARVRPQMRPSQEVQKPGKQMGVLAIYFLFSLNLSIDLLDSSGLGCKYRAK
jgi:hypothetical protein